MAINLRSFVLTGIPREISSEDWTQTTFLSVWVKDKKDTSIYHGKYTNQQSSHAEEELINSLKLRRIQLPNSRKLKRLIDRARKIEIFTNYSPCCDCTKKLLQFQAEYPHLDITITFAFVYRMYISANVSGLWQLRQKGIRIKAFSDDDWLKLGQDEGLEASSLSELFYWTWSDEQKRRLIECRQELDRIMEKGSNSIFSSTIQHLYKELQTNAQKKLEEELEEERQLWIKRRLDTSKALRTTKIVIRRLKRPKQQDREDTPPNAKRPKK